MHLPPRIRRRALAAFAITTVVVMAGVGSCRMPQPKFPSLGSVETPASTARAAMVADVAGSGAVR